MRPASEVMADLAGTGLTPSQIALVMELSATLAAEARPSIDHAAENKRAYDRAYQADRRKNRTTSYESPDDAPAPNKSPPDPQKLTPTPPTHTRTAREAFPRPDWADPQVWADLLTNRRKKNLPNTASAHRKLLADIDKLTDADWPPGRVLEAAVSRGWGAIYAGCKDDDDGRRNGFNGMGRNKPDDGLSSTARAAISVFGAPSARHQ